MLLKHFDIPFPDRYPFQLVSSFLVLVMYMHHLALLLRFDPNRPLHSDISACSFDSS
jgi:hypothetical protein